MQKKGLKNKRKLKKLLKTLGIFLGSFLIFISGFFYFSNFDNKTYFISPLADVLSAKSSDNTQGINELELLLEKEKIDYKEVTIKDEAFIIELKDGSIIILSSVKRLRDQIASLQFMLTRLKMEGKLFTSLDLRFDKPVIKEK